MGCESRQWLTSGYIQLHRSTRGSTSAALPQHFCLTALPGLPSRSVELIPTVARAADVTMQQAGTSGIYCAVRTGWHVVSLKFEGRKVPLHLGHLLRGEAAADRRCVCCMLCAVRCEVVPYACCLSRKHNVTHPAAAVLSTTRRRCTTITWPACTPRWKSSRHSTATIPCHPSMSNNRRPTDSGCTPAHTTPQPHWNKLTV